LKLKTSESLGFHIDNSEGIADYRTYSAVIFLNEDFVGGGVKFKNQLASISAKIGKLIGFGAGKKFIKEYPTFTNDSNGAYYLQFYFTGAHIHSTEPDDLKVCGEIQELSRRFRSRN